MASYDLSVDHDKCTGTGVCMIYAANTFDLDDDPKSFVVDAEGDSLEAIRTAVEACPNQAIILREH